ncbi:mitochondrial translation release factor in rescue isoform X1 [Ixodes scapularis]
MLTGVLRAAGTSAARLLLRGSMRSKHSIDRSRVPVLKDEDIVEQFVHGSGPGGQAVNKLANCVVLCHTPTGVVVRCHESRLQHENRKLARKLLVEKVDEHLNGDMSVSAQKLRWAQSKELKSSQRKARLRELRRQFKEREGLT